MKFYLSFKGWVPTPSLLNYIFNKKLIMRINLTVAVLIVMLLQVSASGFAQRVSFSEKDASMRSVLQKLKNQTGFDLVYNPQMLDEARSVDLELENATVAHALDQIFKDQPLTYTIDEKVIVVKRKVNTMTSVAAQQSITGRVTDNNGSGVPGVTVSIKGTQQATSTDGEGRFVIRGAANAVLVFNMIGYKSVERSVNGAANVDVQLVEDMNMLRDVEVVSTGYQN